MFDRLSCNSLHACFSLNTKCIQHRSLLEGQGFRSHSQLCSTGWQPAFGLIDLGTTGVWSHPFSEIHMIRNCRDEPRFSGLLRHRFSKLVNWMPKLPL